jgi:hypothetical protein
MVRLRLKRKKKKSESRGRDVKEGGRNRRERNAKQVFLNTAGNNCSDDLSCVGTNATDTMRGNRVYSRLPLCLRRHLGKSQAYKFLAVFAALGVAFLIVQMILLFAWGIEQRQFEERQRKVNEKSKETFKHLLPGRKPSLDALAGAHPDKRLLYRPNENGNFACFESGREIPFEDVNDDYCDCLGN